MKSITIATTYYHPETGAGAKRLTAIAEYLAEHGWRVTVVTLLPNYPQNKIYAGFDGPTPRRSSENGVTVIRLRPWIVPKANLVLRLLSETLFSLKVAAHILRHKTDVVLASSPYMFLGPLGLAGSRRRGAKFVWDVRDLTWLFPRATGKRTFGLDVWLNRLMLVVAKKSNALLTATEGLLNYFTNRPELSLVLHNGVSDTFLTELTLFPPPDIGSPQVLYAGLIGYNHGLAALIEAAALLPDIHFTLAGDGPERSALEGLVKSRELGNVTFAGYLARPELLELYRQATVLVSHVHKHPLNQWTQPAKLWEYMATGRPVVHAGEGEAVSLIQAHEAGFCVPPDNPEALAEAIRRLVSDPVGAAALGKRGREFVEIYRRRSAILNELAKLLDDMAGVNSKVPGNTTNLPS